MYEFKDEMPDDDEDDLTSQLIAKAKQEGLNESDSSGDKSDTGVQDNQTTGGDSVSTGNQDDSQEKGKEIANVESQLKTKINNQLISEQIDEMRNLVFSRTNLNISPNDPIFDLTLIFNLIMDKQVSNYNAKLDESLKNLGINIDSKFKNSLTEFEKKQTELQQTINLLNEHKNTIVNDVWGKLTKNLDELVFTNLEGKISEIAKNSTKNQATELNKQRNLLIGGGVGLAIGIVITFAITLLLRFMQGG